MVLQPPGIAWPQASPQLVPWELYVSNKQSSCECFRVYAPHPHPGSDLLFPSVDDEGNHLAIVVPHLHVHDRVSLCVTAPETCLFYSIYQKIQKKLITQKTKLESRFITYLSICRSCWYGRVWVSMKFDPYIGIVIYCDEMSLLPWKEL